MGSGRRFELVSRKPGQPVGSEWRFRPPARAPSDGRFTYSAGSNQSVLTSFSIVAGPSFNSVDFDDDFLNSLPAGSVSPSIDVETSFAVRPGVNVTVTVAPRVAIIGFGGFLFNRPDVVYRDRFGSGFRDRWKADAFVLSAGLVYSLF